MKKYKVDAKNVTDFCERYFKPNRLGSSDFHKCKNHQEAEAIAKADAKWLGCENWEVTKIK